MSISVRVDSRRAGKERMSPMRRKGNTNPPAPMRVILGCVRCVVAMAPRQARPGAEVSRDRWRKFRDPMVCESLRGLRWGDDAVAAQRCGGGHAAGAVDPARVPAVDVLDASS